MHFTNKFLTHLQIFLALKMSDFSQKKVVLSCKTIHQVLWRTISPGNLIFGFCSISCRSITITIIWDQEKDRGKVPPGRVSFYVCLSAVWTA